MVTASSKYGRGFGWFMLMLILPLLLPGCTATGDQAEADYIAAIKRWQQLRIDSLKGPTGFLNLAGLYWLTDEVSTIGADSSNTFVFPVKAAPYLGTVILGNDSVWFVPELPGQVKIAGGITADTALVYTGSGLKRTMSFGDLHWFIIKRGIEYGIRLKDYNHPLLTTFNHIATYPIDPKWRVKATYEPYHPPKTVVVHNQVGMHLEQPVPGALHFTLKGKPYTLEPVGHAGDEEYFVMIYDQTSGHETYGSGRYLYVPRPDEKGVTYIDFNKAFNPPCAFTQFATCLFPHEANRLPLKIEAGEKYAGHH